MAGERTKLIVTKREQLGSRETRRLRKQGIVPGVLYGRSEPVAMPIPANAKSSKKIRDLAISLERFVRVSIAIDVMRLRTISI